MLSSTLEESPNCFTRPRSSLGNIVYPSQVGCFWFLLSAEVSYCNCYSMRQRDHHTFVLFQQIWNSRLVLLCLIIILQMTIHFIVFPCEFNHKVYGLNCETLDYLLNICSETFWTQLNRGPKWSKLTLHLFVELDVYGHCSRRFKDLHSKLKVFMIILYLVSCIPGKRKTCLSVLS